MYRIVFSLQERFVCTPFLVDNLQDLGIVYLTSQFYASVYTNNVVFYDRESEGGFGEKGQPFLHVHMAESNKISGH